MPQIPTYRSGENVSGVAIPSAPRMPTPDYATPVGKLIEAGETFMKAKEQARLADMKLDVEAQFNQLKVDFADREIALRAAGMNPDDYPGAVQQALVETVGEAQKRLKYKDSLGAFQHVVTPFAAGKIIDAKYKAEEIRHAQMTVAAGVVQQEDANTAVSGATPEERQQAFDRGLSRIQGLVRAGVYSGAKGEAETKGFLTTVERAQFLRDFRDPQQRPRVMADLATGRGKHLAPDAQLTLLKELQTQQDTEAEKKRVAEERANQAVADAAEKNIVDAMARKDPATALAELGKARDYIKTGEEYRKWQEFITHPPAERSDPAVVKGLEIAVYGLNGNDAKAIAQARSQVIAAAGAGALNSADLGRLLGHTQSMQTALRNRNEDQALSQLGHRHAAVVDQIQEDLKVSGPMERLVPQAQQVKAMALDELRRRSSYTGGGEDPSDVYRQRRAQWIAHVASAATTRLSEIQRTLDYKDLPTLVANRARFKTEDDYYAAVRLMKQAQEIQVEIDAMKQRGNAAGGASTTTSTQSGGKSLGY